MVRDFLKRLLCRHDGMRVHAGTGAEYDGPKQTFVGRNVVVGLVIECPRCNSVWIRDVRCCAPLEVCDA